MHWYTWAQYLCININLYVACHLLVHLFRMPMMTRSKTYLDFVGFYIFGNFCTRKMHANTSHIVRKWFWLYLSRNSGKTYLRTKGALRNACRYGALHNKRWTQFLQYHCLFQFFIYITRTGKSRRSYGSYGIFFVLQIRLQSQRKPFFVECLRISPVKLLILVTITITGLLERCTGFLQGT